MKKLLPFLLPVIGIAAGIGAGLVLKPSASSPPPDSHQTANTEQAAPEHPADDHGQTPAGSPEYIKLNNQFIVPVIERDVVTSIVVLSLSLEIAAGSLLESVYAREPKLRDGFLQVLFDNFEYGWLPHGAFTVSLRRGPSGRLISRGFNECHMDAHTKTPPH
ncbi:MAG: flagellar basal body-associated protein FliL [Thalassovita sp.]